ncbi:uncharacterized protein GGS22DRAFT_65597 [Annulohypoxylon maeteangense]|uniref:uncharacterized protein n=1 Tax=Annulohypoxylon maeteangense TaxID=1927788 RepID=UPI002007F94F|nr:uncharacterized protein GGS22DRAFT_65597 [Annulohypoxylon maeteangense]KAI0888981.1 hypothetical protein GGS22DRAFT_65597 [Annulohypoxylon maeteangense]
MTACGPANSAFPSARPRDHTLGEIWISQLSIITSLLLIYLGSTESRIGCNSEMQSIVLVASLVPHRLMGVIRLCIIAHLRTIARSGKEIQRKITKSWNPSKISRQQTGNDGCFADDFWGFPRHLSPTRRVLQERRIGPIYARLTISALG